MACLSVSAAVRRILPRGSVPSGTIVKEKPTTETTVLVDEFGEVYATEVEAQEAMTKTKICTVE